MPAQPKLSESKLWKGGVQTYRRLAFEVYKMEKKCVTCGTKDKLHIHHKDKNHNNNSKENLEVLCYLHHYWHHRRGFKQSDEAKKKVSQSLIGNKRTLGIKKSPTPTEVRIKISLAQKGRKFTEEHKLKLKEAWKIRRNKI